MNFTYYDRNYLITILRYSAFSILFIEQIYVHDMNLLIKHFQIHVYKSQNTRNSIVSNTFYSYKRFNHQAEPNIAIQK